MAKIVLSDTAPSDAKSFSLANSNFEVPHETDESLVLSNAAVHPWLNVEYEKVEAISGVFIDRSVAAKDDAMSAENSVANDPEAVRKFAEEQAVAFGRPLAVEAGLDQDKAKTVGKGDDKVAITLAADETPTEDAARARRSTSTEDKN